MRRTTLRSLGLGSLVVVMSLAPLSAASASAKQTSSKGANPNSALCRNLKAQQSSSAKIGNSIASALESGNLATAKRNMLKSINAGLRSAAPALAVLRRAPGRVQNAMRGLISFDDTLKKDIQKASSVTKLESAFVSLGNNAKLRSEATTVSNYITSQCGSLLATTTTTVAP
jgi:hypothetical protein